MRFGVARQYWLRRHYLLYMKKSLSLRVCVYELWLDLDGDGIWNHFNATITVSRIECTCCVTRITA